MSYFLLLRKEYKKKLGITDEEFAKWKFCIINYPRQPEYLEDTKVLSVESGSISMYNEYLGMEHQDNTPHKPHRPIFEPKPVKIYN